MIPLTKPVKIFFGALYALGACILAGFALFSPGGASPGGRVLAFLFANAVGFVSFLSFRSAYYHDTVQPLLFRKRK
jgi:hypothetical protein